MTSQQSVWILGGYLFFSHYRSYNKCPHVLTNVVGLRRHGSDCSLLAARFEKAQGGEKGVSPKPNVVAALLRQ